MPEPRPHHRTRDRSIRSLGHPCAWPDCPARAYNDNLAPFCWNHAYAYYERVHELFQEPAMAEYRHQMGMIKKHLQAETEAKRRAARQGQPGFVYYILINGQIKIGFAADVTKRMRAYPPTAQLLAIEPGSRAVEAERHAHFTAYRQAGREWFRPNPELDAHIAALVTEHGDPSRFAYRYTTPATGRNVG